METAAPSHRGFAGAGAGAARTERAGASARARAAGVGVRARTRARRAVTGHRGVAVSDAGTPVTSVVADRRGGVCYVADVTDVPVVPGRGHHSRQVRGRLLRNRRHNRSSRRARTRARPVMTDALDDDKGIDGGASRETGAPRPCRHPVVVDAEHMLSLSVSGHCRWTRDSSRAAVRPQRPFCPDKLPGPRQDARAKRRFALTGQSPDLQAAKRRFVLHRILLEFCSV